MQEHLPLTQSENPGTLSKESHSIKLISSFPLWSSDMASPSTIASFLGTVLLAISLSKASQINVTIGESVLLPCVVDPPPPPHNTRVYWQTEKVNGKVHVVHFVNMGIEEQIYQDSLYKNRTALDLSQLSAGNYSLVLKNVTKEDNQTTILCLYSSRGLLPIEVSRITLTVLDRPSKPVSDKPDKAGPVSLTVWATGLILVLLLLVACVAGIICKVREKKPELSSNTGTEASGRDNYEDIVEETEKLALNGTEKSIEERIDIV